MLACYLVNLMGSFIDMLAGLVWMFAHWIVGNLGSHVGRLACWFVWLACWLLCDFITLSDD